MFSKTGLMQSEQHKLMQPILQTVLVKPFKTGNVSEGGLIIPDNAKRISNRVKIIAVGNGSKDKPMKLKEGQIGFRVKDWGDPIEIDGELHYLMTQDSIIALE